MSVTVSVNLKHKVSKVLKKYNFISSGHLAINNVMVSL